LERVHQYARRYAPEIFGLPYQQAKVQLAAKAGAPKGSQNAKKQKDEINSRNTGINSIGQKDPPRKTKSAGKSDTVAYVRARLERDAPDKPAAREAAKRKREF
jgi:hypothetical protein